MDIFVLYKEHKVKKANNIKNNFLRKMNLFTSFEDTIIKTILADGEYPDEKKIHFKELLFHITR